MAHIRYKELLARLSWSPQQLAHYDDVCLHSVLEHAVQNVPFYEKHFRQHGLGVRDLRYLKDLTLLPLTSKSDLKNDSESFLARGTVRKNCMNLAGSAESKQGLRVYLSAEECEVVRGIEQRVVKMNGLKGRYSSLMVMPPGQAPPPLNWCARLFRGRRDYLPTTETPAEQLRVLHESQPACVGAPLWILNRLAQEIRKGKSLGFSPRLLLCWGEAIRQSDRETLSETFGLAPTDVYQVWEFGTLATQCPKRDGLHVNADFVHVEIVRNGREVGPGEIGEVVVTTLANRTMPLIRHRVGDVASWKKDPCACGWQGPTLEGVHGQLEQAIVLPSGAFVSPRRFEECLDQFTNVVAYRAIQREPRMVEVMVVPGTLFQERTGKMVREKCIEVFNSQMGVEVKVVNELPLMTGHRRRSVVCKLPHV